MKDLCKDEGRCYKIFFPDSIFKEYGSVDLISTKILISNSWTKIIAMGFWKSLDILDLKYHFIIHFYLNGNDKFLQLLIQCPWSVIKFLLYSLKYLIFAWNKRPVCIFLPSFPQLVYIVVQNRPSCHPHVSRTSSSHFLTDWSTRMRDCVSLKTVKRSHIWTKFPCG